MFEKLVAPDNVVAIRLSGTLTTNDVKHYKALIEEKIASHERFGICVDLTDIEDIGADALTEDAKVEFELMTHLSKFRRCAFVSDKSWPKTMADTFGRWIPLLEMKSFMPSERAAAIDWASNGPARPEDKAPAVTFIPTSNENVLAFEMNGMISSDEMPHITETFDRFLESHDKVHLLNHVRSFGGFEPAALMQSSLFSMKYAAKQKVDRYAVIGGPHWMQTVITTMSPFFPSIEMKSFAEEEEDEAWAWVQAKPAAETQIVAH
jgi:hypothetical protein